eukprot:scaffold13354_cov181-Alexandrium_tamarense.AAC.4
MSWYPPACPDGRQIHWVLLLLSCEEVSDWRYENGVGAIVLVKGGGGLKLGLANVVPPIV